MIYLHTILNRQKKGSEIETSNGIPVASHFQVPKLTRTKQQSLQYCMQRYQIEYSRNGKTNKQAASKQDTEKALPGVFNLYKQMLRKE